MLLIEFTINLYLQLETPFNWHNLFLMQAMFLEVEIKLLCEIW